jgi:predicted lipoprotein
MKKIFKYACMAVVALSSATLISCGDDDDNVPAAETPGTNPETSAADIEYWQANKNNWNNYMINVATLLTKDAERLYKEWNDGDNAYKNTFTTTNETYPTYNDIMVQIIDGCTDIANEVGVAKIGDPYSLYRAGKTTQALYAVESWYSYHSRQDYRNNIYSVRNAFYGSRNATVAEHSLAQYVKNNNAELYNKVNAAINKAANAIWAIPDPFRNHIDAPEVNAAMSACSELTDVLDEDLKDYIQSCNDEAEFRLIAQNYVSNVVLPTYKSLKEKTVTLNNAIRAFAANPSNAGFEKACQAWLDARAPWETSEAFLFGPVADLGLDPNMDSWPLDSDAIVNILKNGDFSSLNWSGEYDEEDEAIEAAQSVRGFHTLEFLLFKNGAPRKVAQ